MSRPERMSAAAEQIYSAFTVACNEFMPEQEGQAPLDTVGQLQLDTIHVIDKTVSDTLSRDTCHLFTDAAFLDATRLIIAGDRVAKLHGHEEKREVGRLLLAGGESLMHATRLESDANVTHDLRPVNMQLRTDATGSNAIAWTSDHEKWIGRHQSPLLYRCPASYVQVEEAGRSTLLGHAFWRRLITVSYCL